MGLRNMYVHGDWLEKKFPKKDAERKMQIEDVVRCEQTMAARRGYKSRTNETGRVFFCKEKKGAVKINNKLIFTFILVPF